MIKFSEFEDQFGEYYDWVLSEYKNNFGYRPIYWGRDPMLLLKNDAKLHEDMWYYCEDDFHGGTEYTPLKEIEDYKEIMDACKLSFLEAHEMAYFSDFAGIDNWEFEQKFFDELEKFFKPGTIDMYDGDISWLLDDYAYRQIFPKLFNYMCKQGG